MQLKKRSGSLARFLFELQFLYQVDKKISNKVTDKSNFEKYSHGKYTKQPGIEKKNWQEY